jgi:hypothetical protein
VSGRQDTSQAEFAGGIEDPLPDSVADVAPFMQDAIYSRAAYASSSSDLGESDTAGSLFRHVRELSGLAWTRD